MKPLLTLLIFSLLIAGFFHPISAFTQDLGRHLLTGEIILKTWMVPKINLFSYTYSDFPFINTHWLSEVIFYLINIVFGVNGLLILTIVVIVAAFALVFFYKYKTTNILALAVASILYLRILFERTDIRPEIFSFLFLSIFIVVLYKYRSTCHPERSEGSHSTANDTRDSSVATLSQNDKGYYWIFILPFLELLWVNIHIYFPIGIAILSLFFVDLIISYIKNPKHEIRSTKQIQMTKIQNSKRFGYLKINILRIVSSFDIRISNLLLVFILSSFVTLFNPNGLSGALYPMHVFQNYGYQIEENQTIFFLWNYFGGKTTILYFFISSSLLFLTLLINVKKTKPIDWLLAIFFTYLAANAERNLPLFVFGTFIPFSQNLSSIFQKIGAIKQFNNVTIARYAATTLFIIFIALQTKQVIQQKGLGIGVVKGAERGADFFIKNNLKGPIFNNFDIGSYLEYRLYPQEKVFIDGRPEAYPATFIQQIYIPIQTDEKLFNQQDQKYNFNTIFFSHTDMTPWAQTFLKRVTQDPQWKIVYLDDYVIVLVKNNKQNENITSKYGMDRNLLRLSNENTLISHLRLANFFRIIGWMEYEEKEYQNILSNDPNSCIALYNLGTLLSQKNNPAGGLYLQRYQQDCM